MGFVAYGLPGCRGFKACRQPDPVRDWVAVKEFNSSHFIGETLSTLYIPIMVASFKRGFWALRLVGQGTLKEASRHEPTSVPLCPLCDFHLLVRI